MEIGRKKMRHNLIFNREYYPKDGETGFTYRNLDNMLNKFEKPKKPIETKFGSLNSDEESMNT